MKRTTFSKIILLGAFVLLSMSSMLVAADAEKNPSEPIKNLQFQSADINSVLTFLSDYGNVNVVVSPEVKGSVTIKLKDVHWRTAMDIIGRTYDLAVVDESDGYIRVLPAENYRKEITENEKHLKDKRELAALKTEIVKVANSTSDDIVEAVKSLMTDRGKASSDSRSNSIIIQEVPSNMPTVLDYISKLDQPAAQIKISTRLLEVSNRVLEELGVNWEVNGTYTTESGRSFPQSASIDANRTSDAAGTYTVQALQKGWDVDAIVQAVVKDDRGRIIAHPEITTIDNKEAKIQMGQKIPVKQFDESGNLVIKFEEVGTILTVTPHITAENQILMELAPERSTYEFDPNGVIINTSNAKTTVIVSNGQTAVIGGLTTEDEVESEIGVPILKDIPIIGRIFKYTNKRVESRDLVIFVTPTIVENELAMNDSEEAKN
ncbi:MAG: hypothetical protein DWP97_08310 [Calditrichaeota bacterium]|nr:MAG: hypothetical protein DWP97_08310 [Calditrichota bacterium]